MNTFASRILRSKFSALWCVAFLTIVFTAPERIPTDGLAGRLFMAFWCASGLTLAALHLFNPPAARVLLDGLFTVQGRLPLFGRERDAYAMSDVAVRAVGIGMLVITSLGFYDIFFR